MKSVVENRLTQFRNGMEQQGIDGLLIHQPGYVYHIIDWLPPKWIPAFLIASANDLILVSPDVPEELPVFWDSVIAYETFNLLEDFPVMDNTISALSQAISQTGLGGKKIGAVIESIPGGILEGLNKVVNIHDVTDVLFSITAVKDEAAQTAIRNREKILDRGFEIASKSIRAERSELEAFCDIYSAMVKVHGDPFVLDCCFGSGSRSLIFEPQPTTKPMHRGEVVLLDMFPNLKGYVADYTRNFVVEAPSEAQIDQHRVLEEALKSAESILRPNVSSSQLDKVVRSTIENEGYGQFMYSHHTGHGFGLFSPEPPWIIPGDQTELQPGMVIAIEPGIYHPENGGMRLEGNYIITEDGYESLAGYPAELIICER
jgi:Xaa-Pro aminopeptidase